MTVPTTLNKQTFLGDGATTSFPFTFACEAVGDIVLYITDPSGNVTQVLSNQYQVILNPLIAPNVTPIGGQVVYPVVGSALGTGYKLTIIRRMSYVQLVSLANQGTLLQAVIEGALDAIVLEIQQISEVVGRNLSVGITDPQPGLLPPVANRAGLLFGFDGAGNPTAVSTAPAGVISAAMAPVVGAATIAQAQALLGIAPSSNYLPVGAEFDYPGLSAPQGFFMELGQAISRAGFPELLAFLAPVINCTVSSGSTTITLPPRPDGLAPTTGIGAGVKVEAPGIIPVNVTIASLTSSTITLSAAPTSNGSNIRIFPFGNGDGSSTYNLPDGRALAYAGMDPQNGTGRLTGAAAGGLGAAAVGAAAGEQAHVTTLGETANHAHPGSYTPISDPTHNHGTNATNVSSSGSTVYVQPSSPSDGIAINNNSFTINPASNNPAATGMAGNWGTVIAAQGGGAAHNNVQPTGVRNKIIYAGRNTF